MDPEKITQIFCPHCRKGVAVHGEIPETSDCPHCGKNFPTAEFAAPRSMHRTAFVSSSPPQGNTVSPVEQANVIKKSSLDSKIHTLSASLNGLVSPAIFWGIAGAAGCLAPFVDGRNTTMGRATTFASLTFLYLLWLRTYGCLPGQTSLGHFIGSLFLRWRQISQTNSQLKAETLGLTGLSGACAFLGGANVLGLLELSIGNFSEVPFTAFNSHLRAAGFLCLIVGGALWTLSKKLRPSWS